MRFYRSMEGTYVWLPEESEEAPLTSEWRTETGSVEREPGAEALPAPPDTLADLRNYDVEHYLRVLVTSYAARLRKAFAPDDFAQLFRLNDQLGLFDRPLEGIQPRRVRWQGTRSEGAIATGEGEA